MHLKISNIQLYASKTNKYDYFLTNIHKKKKKVNINSKYFRYILYFKMCNLNYFIKKCTRM